MKMKITITMVSALAGLALLTGCAGFGHTGPSPDEMRSFVNTLSREASCTGARIDLAENPNHRAAYEAAIVGLQSLVDKTNYSSAEFVRVLDKLPAKLTGSRGAIVLGLIQSGVSLWSAVSGVWIDVTSAPYVEACLKGILYGLREALAEPGGARSGDRAYNARSGDRAYRAALPSQCLVPARKW